MATTGVSARHVGLVGVSLLALGLAFGFGIGISARDLAVPETCDETLTLLTREARCNREYVIDKREYVEERRAIIDYLESEKAAGKLTRYAIYFRDLENGPTFGNNEKDSFVPASLLKLPLMLAYLKLAEENPGLLSEQYAFEWTSNPSLEQYYKPSNSIEPQKAYTIEELLMHMTAYSDNASYNVLVQHLRDVEPNGDSYFETFRELGLLEPTSNLQETLSTKSYASIFRTLYNASYLSPASSQVALDMLAKADFNDGLVAGVPKGTRVAHKFGERSDLPDNQKELHDCGIVYYPDNPYLLCVMTEGHDFSNLTSVIAETSRMVYEAVDARRF